MDALTRTVRERPAAARDARRSQRARFARFVAGVCAAWLAAAPVAAAEPATALEHTVKAAYLYKFLSFVDWPPTSFPPPGSPLVVGVFGADEILAELQKIVPDRTVAGRPVEARRVRTGEPLTGLHVLFVGRAEAAHLPDLARAAQPQSTLVVSETDGGLRLGSVINLVIVDGRVRFEVALDAAERSGLKLSSRLLALAQTVRPGSR